MKLGGAPEKKGGHSRDIRGTFGGHPEDISGTFPGHSRDIPGTFLDIPGTFPGHSRDIPGTFPGHSRDIPGTFPGHEDQQLDKVIIFVLFYLIFSSFFKILSKRSISGTKIISVFFHWTNFMKTSHGCNPTST